MVHAAIGGMQLKRLRSYLKIIVPTLKVLRAVKNADGCLHAETFKSGNVYFAVSVWESAEQMQAFAQSGLHGRLMRVGMDEMKMFYNHSEVFETVPSRDDFVGAWKNAMQQREGRGTVGNYED